MVQLHIKYTLRIDSKGRFYFYVYCSDIGWNKKRLYNLRTFNLNRLFYPAVTVEKSGGNVQFKGGNAQLVGGNFYLDGGNVQLKDGNLQLVGGKV